MSIPRDDETVHAVVKAAQKCGSLQAAMREIDADPAEVNRYRQWFRVRSAQLGYTITEKRRLVIKGGPAR